MQTFAVGDRVQVRSWEDMKKEFGLTENTYLDDLGIPYEPHIKTPFSFLDKMKHLCGETGVVDMVKEITYIMSDGSEAKAQRLYITWDNPNNKTDFSLDNGMFELITEGKKAYVNPIVGLGDENIARKVTISFTFDEPVTKKEAADNINEWFKKGNSISEASVTLTGDIGVKYENVQKRLGANDKDPNGVGPRR